MKIETYGCIYCVGMGFEDYPRQEIPCRLGHKHPPLPILEPLPEPKDKPAGGPWKWVSRGWIKQ